SRTRRPLGREPGRERRMLGLASLETRGWGAPGALVIERWSCGSGGCSWVERYSRFVEGDVVGA
ncbi:hypothetical protein, partial [Nocardia gipuzkoensis]